MRTGIEKLDNKNNMTVEEATRRGRDSVANALTYLTSSKVQNFYARVIGLMDKVSAPGFGTMAVSVHAGRYLFLYDPLFAATTSYEEVCATCEHEVLHLILEHIPRVQVLMRIYSEPADRHLMALTSNLATDMAVNELLARSWPKIKYPDKPLGYWVIPENFTPPLPKDMAYEDYQRLLIDLLARRLTSSPTQLYNLAKKILEKQSKAVQDALKQQSKTNNTSDEEDSDDAEGEGQTPSQDSQSGQSPGQGSQPSQSQGGGQTEEDPLGGMTPEELQSEIENLDPVDQKILDMLVNAMRPHLAWDQNKVTDAEGDTHKLIEHGKELIKATLSNADKSRGTIPGHIMELIRKMLTPPTVPWTQFLHDMVQRTRQTKKQRGMSRPSKKISALKVFARKMEEECNPLFARLPHIRKMPVFPGIKHSNKFTIYYVVDTSGSMSTRELQLGLSELQHIQKSDSEVSICVIYADTHVCKEYWLTATGEIDTALTGRGGTDFERVFQHVKKMCGHQDKAPDIVIYCTDGYAPPPATRISVPTVWLLTPNGSPVMKEAGHITLHMKDYQLEDSSV